jgi:hypothetical protein
MRPFKFYFACRAVPCRAVPRRAAPRRAVLPSDPGAAAGSVRTLTLVHYANTNRDIESVPSAGKRKLDSVLPSCNLSSTLSSTVSSTPSSTVSST